MIASVVVIGALAYVDERRRSEQGLEDFGEEQASIADAARLVVGSEDPASPKVTAMLHELERDGVRVLLVPPVGDARISIAAGERTLRLAPADAARLGLPERTAM